MIDVIKTDGESPRFTFDPKANSRLKVPVGLWNDPAMRHMLELTTQVEDALRAVNCEMVLRGKVFYGEGGAHTIMYTNAQMPKRKHYCITATWYKQQFVMTHPYYKES